MVNPPSSQSGHDDRRRKRIGVVRGRHAYGGGFGVGGAGRYLDVSPGGGR